MTGPLTRRRFIGVTAATAGLSLVPLGRPAEADQHLVVWRGDAMGAVAQLQVHHHDRGAAESLIRRSVAEVQRLERIFSLYRDDSALVALNRGGMLVAPPTDLVDLLTASRQHWEMTAGAFDPTVQALWTLYHDHFSKPAADPAGPSETDLEAALSRVGLDVVIFDRNRVTLPRRGMALTFNGIAQGYVTDKVVAILRAAGVANSLVDMGEPRALGSHPSGQAWRVGIADPDEPSTVMEVVDVVDGAVATSGSYGFRFDREGRFNHLLDPRTGRSAERYKSVTVMTPSASVADALSTAFSLMPADAIASVLRHIGGQAHLVTASGERLILGA